MKAWFVLGLSVIILLIVLDVGCINPPKTDECAVAQDCIGGVQSGCVGDWSCVEGRCIWDCLPIITNPTTTTPTTTTTTTLAGPHYVTSLAYQLPLELTTVSNINKLDGITLSSQQKNRLSENGFVVVKNPFNPSEEDITQMYDTLKDREIPIFITTDSLLHLYHIQFDETLRQVEERQFYDYAWNISLELYKKNLYEYKHLLTTDFKTQPENLEEQIEAYRRNALFFAVALRLLKPNENQTCLSTDSWICQEGMFTKQEYEKYNFTVDDCCLADVCDKCDASAMNVELSLIDRHQGFSDSPIFKYKEDYSQYLPRGHYTRSEKLKNYFRALMWYGRMSFLLKGKIVSEQDAMIQTMQASIIASQLDSDPRIQSMWDRIYNVTAFYVGFSDDLGPYEYNEALNKVFKGEFYVAELNNNTYNLLKIELASYPSPKIYGGTGNCVVSTSEQADQCLEDTKGFRLMGQRFIPDSYMFQNLVYPKVSERFFPKSLDVMALLGSNRAYGLLEESGDTKMSGYIEQYNKLKVEFNGFTAGDWNRNLYWSWLYALKPLLWEYNSSYPTFMQSKAWQDKELNTALASWSELRHDTILYAKQSYTMATSMPYIPPEKPVVGYVEPVPEFYARLLALTRMTNKQLDEMQVLDSTSKYRLTNLERIIERLQNISTQELENKELSQADYDFIKNFGEELNGVIADVEDKAKKTTLVADVHTDTNSNQVLEEGVGYVDMIVVAYKVPDVPNGRILVGAGPVFSYYEFTHPMSDRLTDEKWRQILATAEPERPSWVNSFRSN